MVTQYCAHSFTRNWQLPFLNQGKAENDHRKYFMINPHMKECCWPGGSQTHNLLIASQMRTQLSHWGWQSINVHSKFKWQWPRSWTQQIFKWQWPRSKLIFVIRYYLAHHRTTQLYSLLFTYLNWIQDSQASFLATWYTSYHCSVWCNLDKYYLFSNVYSYLACRVKI